LSTVNEGGRPNKDGIFKSDDFVVRRREKGGTVSEVNWSKNNPISSKTDYWNERGELIDGKTGYPLTTSQMDIDKAEDSKRLKLKYAPADHTKLFDTMFYFLGVSTEPLNKVKENLNKHRFNLESDRDYRVADLEDLQKADSSRSNIKNLIRRYEQEVKPVIDEIEKEIARYESLEKETNRNRKAS
jgi:hypothetical protein